MLSWSNGIWDTGTVHVDKHILFLDFLISRGPRCCVVESWQDHDDFLHNIEMVSSTSVEQSHAVTSSTEETHASKPQALSSLMNYPSKEFIQIEMRKVE